MNITTDNYEGYLMRYADGNLPIDEIAAVEQFLLAHPDLRDEMEAVSSTRIPPTTVHYPGREKLHRPLTHPLHIKPWCYAAAIAIPFLIGALAVALLRPKQQPLQTATLTHPITPTTSNILPQPSTPTQPTTSTPQPSHKAPTTNPSTTPPEEPIPTIEQPTPTTTDTLPSPTPDRPTAPIIGRIIENPTLIAQTNDDSPSIVVGITLEEAHLVCSPWHELLASFQIQ